METVTLLNGAEWRKGKTFKVREKERKRERADGVGGGRTMNSLRERGRQEMMEKLTRYGWATLLW